MPKDNSITSVLIIGSGPIIIGQACEFDYSGTQAARSLREEGVKVILINSNPATIMTDPMMADRVYLLPLTVGFLVSGPVSGHLSDRYGTRPFAVGGLLIVTASFVALLLLPVDFPYQCSPG